MRGVSQTRMARATELRGVVKASFYPFAESQGFVRVKSRNSLFTQFRRARPDALQVFDIQWEKCGGPSFVLNFGEYAVAGVDPAEIAHVDPFEAYPGRYRPGGRLQHSRGPFGWFGLRKPWREALKSLTLRYRPDEVVQQVMDCFPEIEAWWAHRQEGPHIEIIHLAG